MEEKFPLLKIEVFTNSSFNVQQNYQASTSQIVVHRFTYFKDQQSATSRYFGYFLYFYKTFLRLWKSSPGRIWYFETWSSLPVFGYYRFKKSRNSELMIHYHEYVSPKDYKDGSFLIKWVHNLEKLLYHKAIWLSQTNEKRMELFLKDNVVELDERKKIFPNYPPIKWKRPLMKHVIDSPVKLVYVGAVSIETMYFKEICEWVNHQNGKVILDVYSGQDCTSLKNLIDERKYRNIHLKGFLLYDDLPRKLCKYDVGLILYKGHIPNYIYNAPNKLFEYLACHLDVWFPEQMVGCKPYERSNVFPKILPLNFEKLDKIKLDELVDRKGLSPSECQDFCEKIYEEKIISIFTV